MPHKIIKNTFNAGELSEYLSGRGDLSKYYNGCSVALNSTVLPYGGIVKRSGTEFIARAKGVCRIEEFEFSASDTMIIEFGNLYARFYKNDERVYAPNPNDTATTSISITGSDNAGDTLTAASHGFSEGDWILISGTGQDSLDKELVVKSTPTNDTFTVEDYDGTQVEVDSSLLTGTVKKVYEITTTYAEADLFDFDFIQSADVLYIVHQDYPHRKMSRLADNRWTIEDVDSEGGPFGIENTNSDYTLTLTLDSEADDTGGSGLHSTTVLEDVDQSWTVNSLVGNVLWKGDDNQYRTITSNTATTVTVGTAFSTTWEDGEKYAITDKAHRLIEGTSGTLTATGHSPFNSSHANSQWMLRVDRDNNTLKAADNETGDTPTGDGILIKGDFTFETTSATALAYAVLWRKRENGQWQEYRRFTAATVYTATEEDDNVYYTFTHANEDPNSTLTAKEQYLNGSVKFSSYTSATSIDVTVGRNVFLREDDFGGTGASIDVSEWAESVWSDYRGYPNSICFFEDRLWLAGSLFQPQTIWGSKTSDYENFTSGALDNDSVSHTILDSDVSNIQWIAAGESMVAGTTKKEYKIQASNVDDPITPSDAQSRSQTYNGSLGIQPVFLNNALFYAQGQGRKIRAMIMQDRSMKFESDDATLLANHMFESTPVQFATQRIPDSILWVVRSDGTLCSFSYEPKEQVAAWTRHVTGGTGLTPASNAAYFTSVASIRGDTEDNVWVVVKRTIKNPDPSEVYYIEKFSTRIFDQEDQALAIDSAVVAEDTSPSKEIVYASDTVRYGSGIYGSSIYGAG